MKARTVPRYLVTTHRALRGRVASARDAVRDVPDVTIIDARDTNMIHIEASEAVADKLKEHLASTHFVDPETHHHLH
jgi:hypothetical protein